MSYGVAYHEDGTKDWSRFKELAGLEKSDEAINSLYRKIISMAKECIKIAEAAEKEYADSPAYVEGHKPKELKNIRVERGNEVISIDASRRVIKRILMLKKLREQVLKHPDLDENLLQTVGRKFSGLPDWWQYPAFDKAYLEGIAKSGFVRSDLLLKGLLLVLIS